MRNLRGQVIDMARFNFDPDCKRYILFLPVDLIEIQKQFVVLVLPQPKCMFRARK
jgi:hypothetical protein